jgi:PPOX class probable F420-dependent enzyme
VRLSTRECRDRLSAARRAFLATVSSEGAPHVVPITFAVDGDVLVTAVDQKPKSGRPLRRLANIRENPRVAVLADHYAEDWTVLWWVRADGRAAVTGSGSEYDDALRRLADRYPPYRHDPPGGPVIRVEVDRWSGWAAR